jgi:simple sugar transport system permease protein
LIWRSFGDHPTPFQDLLSIIALMVSTSAPVTLGALGGVFSERSGVVNIGIEGEMLCGAFFGATVSALTGQLWLGVLVAPLAGAVLAMLHAVLAIYFRIDQIISGTVINILAYGLTNYLNILIFSTTSNGRTPPSPFAGKVPSLEIPVGDLKYTFGAISIAAVVLVFVGQYVLFNTVWGLRTRATGENPRAADTAGINVFAVRYYNVLISGLLAGLGGAYFSLQAVGHFEPGMTVGEGFIALAAMIFGKWTPLGAWGAALLFGFSQALYSVLQNWYTQVGWLQAITSALPYVLTVIVLTGLIGRSRAPAAVGVPYVK